MEQEEVEIETGGFFRTKKVRYTLDDEKDKIQFELNLLEREITIYPYLLIQEDLICLHVNLTKINPKSFDYKKLNDFNEQSSFLKRLSHRVGLWFWSIVGMFRSISPIFWSYY